MVPRANFVKSLIKRTLQFSSILKKSPQISSKSRFLIVFSSILNLQPSHMSLFSKCIKMLHGFSNIICFSLMASPLKSQIFFNFVEKYENLLKFYMKTPLSSQSICGLLAPSCDILIWPANHS